MKKVLIATDGFLPRWDGISSFLNEIIPRLDKEFAISVIAPDLGELKHSYNANIIRFPILRVRLADNYYPTLVKFKKLQSSIKKSDVVFIQCFGPIGFWSAVLAGIYKKPIIMYNHMIEWEVFPKSHGIKLTKVPINILTKYFAKIMYKKCNVIMVPSQEQADLLSLLGIKSQKKIVHLGVDIKHYVYTNRKEAKKALGISQDTFVVGYGGRLSEEKDLRTLYRAFVRLSKSYGDVHLLIAGGGKPSLEKLFSDKPNITFTGLQDDLCPYYQAMDVYVLPSLVETTSLTTVEAMATKAAVVVTPVGYVKEYIDDGINGMFFPKKNSYRLYKVLEYLKKHPSVRHKLGEFARSTVLNQYTWDKTAKEISKIINGVSGDAP